MLNDFTIDSQICTCSPVCPPSAAPTWDSSKRKEKKFRGSNETKCNKAAARRRGTEDIYNPSIIELGLAIGTNRSKFPPVVTNSLTICNYHRWAANVANGYLLLDFKYIWITLDGEVYCFTTVFDKHVIGSYMTPSLDFFDRHLFRYLFSTGFTLLCLNMLFIMFSI